MGELTPQNPTGIQEMFGSISKQYDLTNSILSLGIHHYWKKKLIRASQIRPGQAVLDCATGTGDLAFLFEKAMKNQGKVVGTDFCAPMLQIARQKAQLRKSKAIFQEGDVMDLAFNEGEFDVASISFGIRNVKKPQQALFELGRVVKPGGRVLVLEFGQPKSKWMSVLFNAYSNWVLPRIGGWLSGQPQAYRYLQTSSAAFPCGEDFLSLAKRTGFFSQMKCYPLQSGIAYLYVLTRQENPGFH